MKFILNIILVKEKSHSFLTVIKKISTKKEIASSRKCTIYSKCIRIIKYEGHRYHYINYLPCL